MTIDIGPNLMELARVVISLVLAWIISRPISAVIEGWGAVKRAKIRKIAEIKIAEIEAGRWDSPGGAQ